MKAIFAVLAAVLWLGLGAASAQPDPEDTAAPAPTAAPAKTGDACKADREKLCRDAKGAELGKCMKDHEADLSEACKRQREKMKARMEKGLSRAKAACQKDIDKFCKDVTEGEGRIARCLKTHVDDLSPSCKIAYDKVDIAVQKIKLIKSVAQGCKDDLDKFCKDAEAGKGGKMRCLKEHSDELSASCKDALPAGMTKKQAAASPAPAAPQPIDAGEKSE